MTNHKTGTREEWLAARLELLEAEKELTRRSDEAGAAAAGAAVGSHRRRTTSSTPTRAGRPSPTCSEDVRSCSSTTSCSAPIRGRLSGLLGDRGRLQRVRRPPGQPRRDALGGVARSAGEAARVQAADGVELPVGVVIRQRLQLRLPGRLHDEQQQSGVAEYNFRTFDPELVRRGRQRATVRRVGRHDRHRLGDLHARGSRDERVRVDDGVVYHTYSAYARGLDGLWGMYQWLDRAPRGRNEARTPDGPLNWFRRHDEYDSE